MLCQATLWILIAFGVVLAVAGLEGYFLFGEYCQRVAEIEGRLDERNSLVRGEIGLNSFELERFGEILSRRYKSYGDEKLSSIGSRLLFGYVVDVLLFFLFLAVLVFRNGLCSA